MTPSYSQCRLHLQLFMMLIPCKEVTLEFSVEIQNILHSQFFVIFKYRRGYFFSKDSLTNHFSLKGNPPLLITKGLLHFLMWSTLHPPKYVKDFQCWKMFFVIALCNKKGGCINDVRFSVKGSDLKMASTEMEDGVTEINI